MVILNKAYFNQRGTQICDRQTGGAGGRPGRQTDRKILPLELTALRWSIFLCIDQFKAFDFGTSLFQTVAGCPTTAELYNKVILKLTAQNRFFFSSTLWIYVNPCPA